MHLVKKMTIWFVFFTVSVKTWLDVWSVDLEELSFVREKNEWKSDVKYIRLQTVVDLCRNYGVYIP